MTARTRVQLSLYLPASEAETIEPVRRLLDPVQHGLIPAHVTLCREEELAPLDPNTLAARCADPRVRPLALRFGRAERFHGHGLLLPCVAGAQEYQALRELLLDSRPIRQPSPHVTLAHPRNPEAPGNHAGNFESLPYSLVVTFTRVELIEQVDAAPWRVLSSFRLGPEQ